MAAAVGCTKGPDRVDGVPPANTASAPAVPARVPYDPPAQFKGGVLLPWEASSGLISVGGTWLYNARVPVALHQDMAYVATTDRMIAFDTTRGEAKGTITPEGESLATLEENNRNYGAPPVVAGSIVLAPFLVRQAGIGTQAARTSTELVAADAATGKLAWRLPIAVPEWTKDVSSRLTASVVGAYGNIAVVTVAHERSVFYSGSTTYAVDLSAHRVLWSQDFFKAFAVTDGIVTGEKRKAPTDDYSAAAGYDLATGAERWHGEDLLQLGMQPAGPNLVFLAAQNKSDYRVSYRRFLDPATGAVKQNDVPGGSRCEHDEASTVVCFGGDSVVGIDATTGATLWQLPDKTANRIAPKVTAVWHGRVYGKTANGTVALDARTGADMPSQPGAAPDLVNAYTAIAIDPSGNSLMAYQAVG
ncbi:PQQ-binding-like beta-propeller repeat protein [Streptomyces sp. NPDC058646]|uniref:outer membrane protein assembly factor BamB family protein n=1 Tax=Streptomyces sp. NPDC058646 TaxID=3346574 RepID=UPI00364FB312